MNPFESQLLFLRIVILLLVYAFLLSVLWFLWRDLREAAPRAARPRGGARQLVVVAGDEAGLRPGDTFSLQPVTELGRDLTNTVVVPDAFASAQHARLTLRDGQWWLEDLDSRNGTFINNHRIVRPTPVRAGDVIRVGRVGLRLEG